MLLRLQVPRLSGHSVQDTQTYKSDLEVTSERARDPLPKLKNHLVPNAMSHGHWEHLKEQAQNDIEAAVDLGRARALPDPKGITKFVFSEIDDTGQPITQMMGGLAPNGHVFPTSCPAPASDGKRINMVMAIRKTLDYELDTNPNVVVFGQDVGAKGGIHTATLGLQDKYGSDRVFDTSLSEEGIIGRTNGLAMAGLV